MMIFTSICGVIDRLFVSYFEGPTLRRWIYHARHHGIRGIGIGGDSKTIDDKAQEVWRLMKSGLQNLAFVIESIQNYSDIGKGE